MSPLYNPDGSPFTEASRFTSRDPQFELAACAGCRFTWPHKCLGHVTFDEGRMAGVHRCACSTCAVR